MAVVDSRYSSLEGLAEEVVISGVLVVGLRSVDYLRNPSPRLPEISREVTGEKRKFQCHLLPLLPKSTGLPC